MFIYSQACKLICIDAIVHSVCVLTSLHEPFVALRQASRSFALAHTPYKLLFFYALPGTHRLVVGGGHAARADTSPMCVAARAAANESRVGNADDAGALRMPGQSAHLQLNCLEETAAF
jgi:hypothetical protein